MNRYLILFLSCWLSSSMVFGQVVLNESFDAATLPTGWTSTAISGGPWVLGNPNSNSADYAVADLPEHTGNAGNYVWMDFSSTDDAVTLTAPGVDVSALTTPYLSFAYESHISGVVFVPGDFNFLSIEAWTGTSWTSIDTLTGNTPYGWDVLYYDLTGFTYANGDSARVRFVTKDGLSANNFYNDLLLDDIMISEMPSCLVPSMTTITAIRSNDVDVTWMGQGTALTWEVNASLVGTPLGTGPSASAAINVVNLSGLMDDSDYQLAIRAICGPGDTSAWSFVRPFTTPCAPATPSYTYDFTNFLGNCWLGAKGTLGVSSQLTYGPTLWLEDGYRNVGNNGSANINIYSTSRADWIISRSIDLTGGPFQVEFDVALTDFNSTDPECNGF